MNIKQKAQKQIQNYLSNANITQEQIAESKISRRGWLIIPGHPGITLKIGTDFRTSLPYLYVRQHGNLVASFRFNADGTCQ